MQLARLGALPALLVRSRFTLQRALRMLLSESWIRFLA